MIRKVTDEKELMKSLPVIHQAFKTVADDMKLTMENCPAHPSFLSKKKLVALYHSDTECYQLLEDNKQIGFLVIEKSPVEENTFYIEKLAVLPECRHHGYGKQLMQFAMERVKSLDGEKISVALIDSQTILKDWYQSLGFTETGKKTFDHLPFDVCFMTISLVEKNQA